MGAIELVYTPPLKVTLMLTQFFMVELFPLPAPTIPPKDLMKQTIELYSKTVSDLVAQGYPRPMAEQAAKKYILGG